MVQLKILSGNMAGDFLIVRHFPFRIGRAQDSDFQMNDLGVWDNHLALEFRKNGGVFLRAESEAFVAVNEQPQTNVRLRNGDVISFGSANIQFWLAPVQRLRLLPREMAVWLILAGVIGFQLCFIYHLLR